MPTGTLTGTLQIVTGGGAHQMVSATGQVIVRKGTERLADQRVQSGSTFLLTVLPGTYQIASICVQSQHVTQLSVPKTVSVKANVATRADVRCLLNPHRIVGHQSAGTARLPKASVIEITGYEVVAEAGSRGPITEAITGSKAQAPLSALENSPAWKKAPSHVSMSHNPSSSTWCHTEARVQRWWRRHTTRAPVRAWQSRLIPGRAM